MNVYELVEHLNGELVSNKAFVRVDGKSITVGVCSSDALEFTEEGVALAATLDIPPAAKRGRNKPAETVGEE